MQIDFTNPSLADNLPGTPLQQSGTYAAVLRSFGCETAVAQVSDDGALIGRARIHARRIGPLRIAWLPRGPVWSDSVTSDQKRRALTALPRAAPWRALWAIGGDAAQLRSGLPVARGLQIGELDLTPCEDARRAAQHGKWRNRLVRAEAAGLTVTARPLDMTMDAPLLAQEVAQRRIRRYGALPQVFIERWAETASDSTLMLTASEAGTPIAFMLMLLHAPTATYHIGWTGQRGRALNAHTLLMWRAAGHLAQSGYTQLDLGRVDCARTPGIARFKMGAGAALRDLGPTALRL
ncbi:GNAT family N-acetyltransferase [Roseovarius sp. Pro17]|uniref:GNAT family N-acetyltransferase n=1 Tax=Roseovarius sp. Pro17 TaxID=3108175 RepID=UPI002D7794D4|nr:GNAT family N-acetyltransferase [Roseovarius sp. Pro17]